MWEIDLKQQLISLLCAVLLGIVLSMYSDIFRIIRKVKKHSKVSVFIEDLLFFMVSAFVTFMLLMARCNGEVRGYMILGEALGFLLFRLTVSRITLPFFYKIISFIAGFFSKISGVLARFGAFTEEKTYKLWQNLRKIIKKVKFIRKKS